MVPSMNNLSVRFDKRRYDPAQMLSALQKQWQTQSAAADPVSHAASAPRLVQIPVQYGGKDGPDLALVAVHCGMSPAQVIAAHSEAEYRVYFLGFQPGFAYLGSLPESLFTLRRAEPRLSAPAGSVGIGGAQTGIYTAASPGGWQLTGRTALAFLTLPAQNPAGCKAMIWHALSPSRKERLMLELVRAGLHNSVQDQGPYGFRHLGVAQDGRMSAGATH
ncbi:5-oxoprolinase subunit PxpB [Undibacterium crateris]|uniref:5-oxoprolinase subunit PxpB n=1 Tax=Undibacterium crateris TaxID=2528175 RepID=UPI002E29F5EF|nr:5-oxoprolinase subunit PxpB [Undibacterium crateris]